MKLFITGTAGQLGHDCVIEAQGRGHSGWNGRYRMAAKA